MNVVVIDLSINTNMTMIIDLRESVLIEEAKKQNLQHETSMLEVADVVGTTKAVAIEIKNIKDFVMSIFDGTPTEPARLWKQSKNMLDNFDHCIFLIIGSPFEIPQNINIHAYLGAIASLSSKGISILFCATYEQAAYLCFKLIEKHENPSFDLKFVPERTKANVEIIILSQAQGISPNKAKLLLEKFGSLKAVLNATDKQLQEVEGIGKKSAISILTLAALIR